MPDISKITLPSGSTYDIKDATARSDIQDIWNSFQKYHQKQTKSAVYCARFGSVGQYVLSGNS